MGNVILTVSKGNVEKYIGITEEVMVSHGATITQAQSRMDVI